MICIHCGWTALLPRWPLSMNSYIEIFSDLVSDAFPFQVWFLPAQNGTGHHPARGMDLSQVLQSKLHRLCERVDCSFGSYRYLLAHPHVPLRAINQVQTPDLFWDLEWWVLEGFIATVISLNQFWRQDFAVQAGNLKREDIQITPTETCETTHWSGTVLLWTLASKTNKTKPFEKTNEYSEWNGRTCRLAGNVPTPGLHVHHTWQHNDLNQVNFLRLCSIISLIKEWGSHSMPTSSNWGSKPLDTSQRPLCMMSENPSRRGR